MVGRRQDDAGQPLISSVLLDQDQRGSLRQRVIPQAAEQPAWQRARLEWAAVSVPVGEPPKPILWWTPTRQFHTSSCTGPAT